MQRAWKFLRRSCAAIFVLGLLVRVTLRDAYPVISLVYYMTPWPVLIALLVPETVTRAFRRQQPGFLAMLTLMLALLFVWMHQSYRLTLEPPGAHESALRAQESTPFRIVFWTADTYEFVPLEEAAEDICKLEPDIIALIEGNVDWGRQIRVYGDLFPDHQIQMLPHSMLMLHQGRLHRRVARYFDKRNSALTEVELRQDDLLLHVALLDQRSTPTYSRKQSFGELADYIRTLPGDKNFILMGDFNTPVDSVHLRPFREILTPAFEAAGVGWAETWPSYFPVHSLDQVWTGPTVRVLRCTPKRLSFRGHRALVIDVTFKAPPSETAEDQISTTLQGQVKTR